MAPETTGKETIPADASPAPAGIVLAAGAGRRLGLGPKAWLSSGGITLADRAVRVCLAAGVRPVLVIPSAALSRPPKGLRAELEALARGGGGVVVEAQADDDAAWPGLAESFRSAAAAVAALAQARTVPHCAVLLVDQPGVSVAALRRVIAARRSGRIARATYAGRPGHPVVMSLPDLLAAADTASGDSAGRAFLATEHHRIDGVECGDVAHGEDVDVPEDLALWPPDRA